MTAIVNAFESANQELLEKINCLPVNMTVHDVADFLGICPATAYKLAALDDFPKVRMNGVKRVVIPKSRFVNWYLSNGKNNEI